MKNFSKAFASVLLLFALLELGLRIFPVLIPIELLVNFREEPRAEIAERLHLPKMGSTLLYDRDDGGPPDRLRLFKPFTKFIFRVKDFGVVKTVMMDKTGFCNSEQNEYDFRTVDIITLGDSFTWCHNVYPEESWTSKLSFLTGRSTYNLGRGGMGPYEYLQIFKRFGLQKSPKIVIMNVYEGNDLRDAVIYHSYRENAQGSNGNQPTPSACRFPPRYQCLMCGFLVKGMTGRYSYAYNLAVTAGDLIYLSLFSGSPDKEESKSIFRYRLMFSGNVIRFNLKDTDTDEVVQAMCLRTQQIGLEVFTEALRIFVDLSRQHRFVPVVTYTPSAHSVYAANVVFDDPALADLMPWFSREQRNFFKTKAEELGYVFIDLTSFLQNAAAGQYSVQDLLYLPQNLHLTERGHGVVAETISRALQGLSDPIAESIATN